MSDTELSKICFVIMPIADVEGYDPGHFNRVYEFIIKPACRIAQFKPIRADEVKKNKLYSYRYSKAYSEF